MSFRKWICAAAVVLFATIATVTYVALGSADSAGKTDSFLQEYGQETMEVRSNRHIHEFQDTVVNSTFDLTDFERLGETDALTLWLNRKYGAIRIVDKATGYLWGALPLEKAEGLNSTWNCYGNSLVGIECFDEKGKETRLSIGKNGKAEYEVEEDKLNCHVTFQEVGISFSVEISFFDNRLTYKLVEGSLQEGIDGNTNRLKSMTFMPFLGASYSDSINGYMLIPDGSGALIRFRQPANYSSTFDKRVYGTDLAIDAMMSSLRSYEKEEHQVMLPIYGIVHGAYQNAFLSVIEQGAEYTSIVATPALTNNPYNWAAARFEFRQKYVKNINRKEGAGTVIPQEVRNEILPKVSFYFVHGEEANYDKMAVLYRNALKEDGILADETKQNTELPLRLEVLGADKKQHFYGKTTCVFTTAEQATEIVKDLQQASIKDISFVFRCFTKNNETGRGMIGALGNRVDFEALQQQLTKEGGSLYYYVNPITANEDQINLRTEAANNLSNLLLKETENQQQGTPSMYPDTYFYRMSEAGERLNKMKKEFGMQELALDQLSFRIYGDYTSGKEVTRKENLAEGIRLIQELTDGQKLPMYRPNVYLWKHVSEAYDLPSTNSQLLYESDSVPFLQIVLSGSVSMFSTVENTPYCSRERLLRQIEYGMAPSFLVTGCESIELYQTAQEKYISSSYQDWNKEIKETYLAVADALKATTGFSIRSHTCIREGVTCTGYTNGVNVYVNYTDEIQRVGNLTIQPRWYFVEKQEAAE